MILPFRKFLQAGGVSSWNRPERIRSALILVIVATIGLLISLFIGYRLLRSDPQKLISSIQQQASMSIGKVHQVSTRDGIKEWVLDAESAQVVDEARKLMLEGVSVVYFLSNGDQVTLKGKNGFLKTDSSDIEVFGDVVVTYQTYRLETARLLYDHGQRQITCPTQVVLTSETSVLTADSMSFDLNQNRSSFEGNVEVIFHEHIRM